MSGWADYLSGSGTTLDPSPAPTKPTGTWQDWLKTPGSSTAEEMAIQNPRAFDFSQADTLGQEQAKLTNLPAVDKAAAAARRAGFNALGKLSLGGMSQQEADLAALEKQGVSTREGTDFGTRLTLSMTPIEKRGDALNRLFGEQGWTETPAGIVALIPEKGGGYKKVLVDERQATLNDLAGIVAAAPELAGGLAAAGAAVVAAPAYFGTGMLSAAALGIVAAVGSAVGGGASDAVMAMRESGLDWKTLSGIAERRGVQAAADSVLNILTSAGANLVRLGRAPYGKTMQGAEQQAVVGAEQRLRESTGVDLQLTPGTVTMDPTLQAVEALASKVPGSRGAIAEARRLEDRQIAEITTKIAGKPEPAEKTGQEALDLVNAQNQSAAGAIDRARERVGMELRSEMDRLRERMRPGSAVSMSEAGEFSRLALEAQKNAFKARQKTLEDNAQALIDQLPEAEREFAKTTKTAAAARSLIDEFPKTKVATMTDTGLVDGSGKPIVRENVEKQTIWELFPPETKKWLDAFANKMPETATIDELRKVRQVVNNAINDADALPGLSSGMLRRLSGALTADIEAAIKSAPTPEIREALETAVKHYRDSADGFTARVVSRALRDPSQGGFLEGEDLLPGLILKGRHEDASRIIAVIGKSNPDAVAAARRSAFDQLMDDSKNTLQYGRDQIDPKKLINKLDSMSEESRGLLFGSKVEADRAYSILETLAARYGEMDISLIRRPAQQERLLQTLERTLIAENQRKREFENSFIRPMLQGAAAEGDPAVTAQGFIKYIMRSADTAKLEDFMARVQSANPGLAEEIRKQVVVDVLGRGRGGETNVGRILELAGEGQRGQSKLASADRKSTRLNSSHVSESRMPSSA